jgi:CspA family cold shock protein
MHFAVFFNRLTPEFHSAIGTQGGIVMTKGKVKWFNDSKGFGFITRDDGSEVFVHHASIQGNGQNTLTEGDMVNFDLEKSTKGLRAINVVKL